MSRLCKSFLLFVLMLVFGSCEKQKLDTKLIANKYQKGVVKVLIFDPELEKKKEGSGYLSRGSGFFVTDDGYLFTNKHVVEYCVKGYIDYNFYDQNKKIKPTISVYSEDIVKDKNLVKVYNTGHPIPVIQVFNSHNEEDYKLYKAEVVAIGSGNYDGALLKIVSDFEGNPVRESFTTIPIGNSDDVAQGEQLCVFGYPQQVRGSSNLTLKDMSTLSIGIMSGLDFNFNSDYGYLKTDAEIHGGNSGGPVFSEKNKVIGIATAKGNITGIGLVSGINGMYYISAIDSKAHKQIMDNGLTMPERLASINTMTGEKQSIKTAKEINAIIEARKPKKKPSLFSSYTSNKTGLYTKSQVYFSNVSVKQNDNKIPGKSKQYTRFSMDKNKGGRIWVYVDNYPNKLNTEQLRVYLYKYSNFSKKYTKVKDLVYNVNKSYDYTFFSYDFYEVGKYKFYVYSKESKFINSGELELYFE
ncbi:trypsin-like peptidase domain-containing protein [Seonamhaeicola sp. NFXS20]|uniref:S1 family peptidase n=2 Tax=unclassified Seonamhaeicola TaxID=2622645 RepID=UPI003B8D1351